MTTKHSKAQKRKGAGQSSWLALVAATTLGIAHADTLKAEISIPRASIPAKRLYRLVVQSYANHASATLPTESRRPLGSTQRAVTADDLVQGISVNLVEFNDTPADRGVVLAWVEPGEPDLEFDARTARPAPGSFYGVAQSGGGDPSGAIAIRLDRRVEG